MIAIEAVPKRYAWGSYDRLQRLFRDCGTLGPAGEPGVPGPLAEMWFSGHAGSPSLLHDADAPDIPGPVNLDDAIRGHTDYMVGPTASRMFGPVLPYLFKVISARIPLSLQVHPIDFEARAGYNREQDAGVPRQSPERSFKDMLAKHEMVVALEPFEASVGFMPGALPRRMLKLVDHPVAADMVADLSGDKPSPNAVVADAMMPVASRYWTSSQRRIFRAFHLAVTAPADRSAGVADALCDALTRLADSEGSPLQPSRRTMRLAFDNACKAAAAFPDDPSVLALLLMNPVRLGPGESVFIPAGLPHAYIRGTAAEIMTNSDNVLRAGMTPKHKDIPNLLRSLNCSPAVPVDPRAASFGTFVTRDVATYRPHVNEFMLAYGRVGASEGQSESVWPVLRRLAARYGDSVIRRESRRIALPSQGPRVLLCCSGLLHCADDEGDRVLRQGQAVFVPAAAGHIRIEPVGNAAGSFLLASTPF
ncbi:mannose-6-phosphate isomerase, class I [Bifidobacterium sp. UBA744]|uniref:mannose-6-phosphate isomerase, class I n=1 Tax=Bifidobacterium sp. UBA744 TaxID=1946112 RepID=UPI0025B9E386|nr:mannose-6-phosphate isomerase, class I [Bifidobacterium sp. UBA744]